jgi:hypothetical protein
MRRCRWLGKFSSTWVGRQVQVTRLIFDRRLRSQAVRRWLAGRAGLHLSTCGGRDVVIAVDEGGGGSKQAVVSGEW